MAKNKKKNKKKIIIFSVLGVLVIALIAVAIINSNKEKIIKVTTEEVKTRDITQVVNATGSINPIDKVVITPEVTGEIVELPVEEGDTIKKGDLLIKIKPDIYIAQRNRAIATLESAKANLAVAKANLDKVDAEYNRIKQLFEKELASQQDLDSYKASYLSSKGQYKAQVASITQAEESLKEKEEDLAKTTIFSPLDGVVSKLNVELGEKVLGSGFSQGTNIMTVSDLTNMEALVEVDENDVVLVSVGDTARINIDAFGDEKFQGVVYQVGNSAITSNAGSQDQVVNFEIKIKLLGENQKIKPGMSCDADIATETKNNVLAIPIQSLTARLDKPIDFEGGAKSEGEENSPKLKDKKKNKKPDEVVFLLDATTAKKVVVKTGISDDDYIEVISGLEGGETVISGPYKSVSRELEDGTKVIKDDSAGKRKFNKRK